jgi:hypothetical protein
MNGFIRHAHRLTFLQIVTNMLAWKVVGGEPSFDWTERWNAALASIQDREVMADLINFHQRTAMLVSERVVLGSPVLMTGLIIGIVIALCHMGWTSLRSAFNTAVCAVTAKVIDPRLLDEDAARAAA